MLLFVCFINVNKRIERNCLFSFERLISLSLFLYSYVNFGISFLFTDMDIVVVVEKWLFSERFVLYLERHVHSKNKQMLMPDFFLNNFFDYIFFDQYFSKLQEALNKLTGWHITEERAKSTWWNYQINLLYLHKSLASFFTKIPI